MTAFSTERTPNRISTAPLFHSSLPTGNLISRRCGFQCHRTQQRDGLGTKSARTYFALTINCCRQYLSGCFSPPPPPPPPPVVTNYQLKAQINCVPNHRGRPYTTRGTSVPSWLTSQTSDGAAWRQSMPTPLPLGQGLKARRLWSGQRRVLVKTRTRRAGQRRV